MHSPTSVFFVLASELANQNSTQCSIDNTTSCILQGSSAFVYGWMYFADRLSNGVIVKIIQQFTPESSERSVPRVITVTCSYTHFETENVSVICMLWSTSLHC